MKRLSRHCLFCWIRTKKSAALDTQYKGAKDWQRNIFTTQPIALLLCYTRQLLDILSLLNMSLFPSFTHLSLQGVGIAAVILAATYLLVYTIYQLFANPLASLPGPLWAKVTPFWLTLQCRRTERLRGGIVRLVRGTLPGR